MTTTDAATADELRTAPTDETSSSNSCGAPGSARQGGDEELLQRNPVYAYLVGTLYPVESGEVTAQPIVLDEEIDPDSEVLDDELGDRRLRGWRSTSHEDADERPRTESRRSLRVGSAVDGHVVHPRRRGSQSRSMPAFTPSTRSRSPAQIG